MIPRQVLAALAMTGALLGTARLMADPSPPTAAEQAKARYLKGKEMYAAGNFAGAIAEWEAAYKLAPNPALHFNLGRAHEQAGNAAAAVAAYQRYLKESPGAPDRATVEASIKRLQQGAAADRESADRRAREEQAAARFRKGRELYQAGRYKDALEELSAAFQVVPSPTLVYNMAKTREKLGDLPGAIADYRRYLEMEPNAQDKGDVEFIIRTLSEKDRQAANELALESSPPGADVYLDGSQQMAGQTPLSVKVTAGPHTLRVEKNGFEASTREFVMPADRPLTLTFDLRPMENVGWLTVACDRDGAHVFLDGTILALTPYKDRKALPAGRHQVVVEHEGFKRFTAMVEVVKDRETHVAVRMESASGRSRAPLLLVPALGLVFSALATGAAITAGAFVVRARSVIDGSPAWMAAIASIGGASLATVVLLFTGMASTALVVGIYAALGLSGRGGGEVTIRPPSPRGPAAAPSPSPAPVGATAPAGASP